MHLKARSYIMSWTLELRSNIGMDAFGMISVFMMHNIIQNDKVKIRTVVEMITRGT